jgi:serine protease Do
MVMYRKWITLALMAVSLAAVAQTDQKEKSEDSKEKSKKVTIVVDGENVIVNGKNLKDMSPEEKEKLGDMNLRIAPSIRLRGLHNGDRLFDMDEIRIRKPEGTPRAFLGVMSEKNEKGAKITSVTKESAAAKAGLQKDDIITKVNDQSITDSEDLFETIRKFKPEDKVTISYLRDGQQKTTTAVLGKTMDMDVDFNFDDRLDRGFNFEMPELRELEKLNWNFSRKPRLGIEIQDTEDGKGVQVIEVEDETPAQKAGLQEKDIITSINGKSVTSVDEIKAALKDLKDGDLIKAGITRSGKTQTLDIKIPKKLKTADL